MLNVSYFSFLLTDARYPDFTKVELIFAATAEKVHESDYVPDSNFPVDNTDDPLIRWDSYEHFNKVIEGEGEGSNMMVAPWFYNAPYGINYRTLTKS